MAPTFPSLTLVTEKLRLLDSNKSLYVICSTLSVIPCRWDAKQLTDSCDMEQPIPYIQTETEAKQSVPSMTIAK
jgi:hypothetical protein